MISLDAATVLLQEKVVFTNQPVDIRTGQNVLTGVGMRMESESRQLQVDSQVRGHIAPRDGNSTGKPELLPESSR